VEFASVGRDHAVEIHVILGEGSCLIEAAKLNDAASDDFILGNAENLLLVESLQGVDDAEGHAHRQGWRDGDEDDVDELDDQV